MNSNLEKFKKAMELLEEIAVQFPSEKYPEDCFFDEFTVTLNDEEYEELRQIHEKTHWKPFSIFL